MFTAPKVSLDTTVFENVSDPAAVGIAQRLAWLSRSLPVLIGEDVRIYTSVVGFQRTIDRHVLLTGGTLYSVLRLAASGHYKPSRRLDRASGTCFVLGNGPSLGRDLSPSLVQRLSEGTTICVNFFPVVDEYVQVKPSHLVFVDQIFWRESSPFQAIEDRLDALFAQIRETTTWPLSVHVPNGARRNPVWNRRIRDWTDDIEIEYYSATPVIGYRRFRHAVYRLGIGMPPVENVLAPALFLALKLGFTEVILLGADHDVYRMLEVDAGNTPVVRQGHYGEGAPDPVPFYAPGSTRVWTMAEIFSRFSKMFRAYEYLDEYAGEGGAVIVNATSGSAIDAFGRAQSGDQAP